MDPQTGGTDHHPVARVLAWVFGILTGAATLFLGYVVVRFVTEFSGYTGEEMSIALTALGFVTFMTLVLWLLFLIPWNLQRPPRRRR
ncbi:hypothetical protein OEB99_05660 [Actinotalea sp. M2MS4P-6]|uniref:hypothetical protein n=1 Tax=Actinotalea sp. M2MS4P-6 TaxID=2983762 RepID=UPI0021E366B0|nr:hypothetical protein [Actinotalea sp. M2MS4P-6]MCV2393789.1 hypothetical protein [Actinotalea sp. M2MS4P-6]